MKAAELKKLAEKFAIEYVDGDVIGVDYCRHFPLGVKVVFYNDLVLEVTSDVADLYHGSAKTIFEHDDMSYEWQEFVIDKAIGKAKMERTQTYLKTTLADLVALDIDELASGDKDKGLDYNSVIDKIEKITAHVNKLLTIKFDLIKDKVVDIKSARFVEQEISADHNQYLREIKTKLDDFLAEKVAREINEQGDEVYSFSEAEYELYEAFKDSIYDLDFSLRQKLYTLDNIEAKESVED